jgi:hypothetical protein
VEDLRDENISLPVVVSMLENYSCYNELRKQGVKNVNMFVYNPEIWVFFNTHNLKSLEMMSAIGLNDNTALIRRLIYYSFPTTWIALPIGVFGYGSKKHKYLLRYSFLRPFEKQQAHYDTKLVDQKMRKLMFRNSAYHLLNKYKMNNEE